MPFVSGCPGSPDVIYLVTLPASAPGPDLLDIDICSRGYEQRLHVFRGRELAGTTASTAPGADPTWALRGIQLQPGETVRVVLDARCAGFPFGSWRGGAGLRIKWRSGRASPPVRFHSLHARDIGFPLPSLVFPVTSPNLLL